MCNNTAGISYFPVFNIGYLIVASLQKYRHHDEYIIMVRGGSRGGAKGAMAMGGRQGEVYDPYKNDP